MYIGLKITADTPNEILESFPVIPLSLLKTNSVVSQAISTTFPDLFRALDTNIDVTVHLHWLVLAGGLSFIANILQLLPIDNSAGGKMSLAVLGPDNYILLNIFAGIIKFVFFVPMIFNMNGVSGASNVIDMKRLLVDYILSSQLAGGSADTQQARDSITEVTESRKIAFAAFVTLLLLSLLPYSDIVEAINSAFDNGVQYLKSII